MRGRTVPVCLIACVVATAVPQAARAQGAGPRHTWPTEHVFVGGGAQMVSTGAGASASLSDAALEFAEIGVRARRVGAGMEFTRLGSVKGSSSYHIVKTAEDERESALLFLVQVRAVALGLVSIDVVGGAGVAWHRESVTVTPQPICCFPTPPSITSIDRARTGALVMGADVPLRLARILSIVPRARFYNVTRVTTAVLARTSMRSGVGVSVRVMW